MLEKLNAVRNRFDEINRQLQEPAVVCVNKKYADLMKEYKKLTPLMETYDEYRAAQSAGEQALELLEEGGLDPEFKALARRELTTGKREDANLGRTLESFALPKDENDDRSVIVEIRGGAGGEGSGIVCAQPAPHV